MDKILFFCYGDIAQDGRILRSINAIIELGLDPIIISYSKENKLPLDGKYLHVNIKKGKRHLGLIQGMAHVIKYVSRYKTKFVYFHDYYYAPALNLVKALFPNRVIVYDSHELLVPLDEINGDRRNNFFYKAERRNIKSANIVISANKERAKVMEEKYQLNKNIYAVRNIPELHDTNYKTKAVSSKKILVYQGAIYPGRGIDVFIKAMQYFDDNTLLMIVGDGPLLPELKKMAEELELNKKIKFLGKVSANELYRLLVEECDFGIITYSNENLNNQFCAPNKLYEYIHLGLPFITTSQETILSEVRGYDFYTNIDLDDSVEVTASKIRNFIANYVPENESFRKFCELNNWDSEKKIYSKIFTENVNK
ncbi:glycosyltransferase [Chitinophaga defluvii]|uniref:Glycosyltransferase n=1 Tax=Chitinophaga defluvii TaxID=3163343 RepID=A0ABV2T378_9BACT